MSNIKRMVDEIQEFYDRLYAAQQKKLTPAEKASFEAELLMLKAKYPLTKASDFDERQAN
jgi:hypothetical protein